MADIKRVGVVGCGLMTLGCARLMGPLALADLVGLTAAGRLGRKTGRGFYDYQESR